MVVLYALHGFLGLPTDWTTLFDSELKAIDLFAEEPCELKRWGARFNASSSLRPRILMGYSLGGRLAMHALLSDPGSWEAAIIISAHPGLASEQERAARRASDEQWAMRFEKGHWDSLMAEWNSRDVFKSGSHSFQRQESHFDRSRLASALRMWSLGKQEDLAQSLNQCDRPILWMVGQNDANYINQTKRLNLKHPLSKISVIPTAGHRAPWEQPKHFLDTVTSFISQVEQLHDKHNDYSMGNH